MAFPVGAAVAAGASLLGSGGQIMATGKMNRKTRQWNEMMYGRQRADSIADWQMQNEYNSPQAQMARYEAAGLNKNLIYGQTHEAGPVKSTDVKAWNPDVPDVAGLSRAAAEGIGAYQDFTLQQETVKNMQAQRKNLELDATLKALDAGLRVLNSSHKSLDLYKAAELVDTEIATAKEKQRAITASTDIAISKEVRDAAMHAPNLAAAFERVANLAQNTAQSKAQVANLKRTGVLQDLEINMRKLGLTFNDNLVLRMLAQFMEGKSLPDLIREFSDGLRNREMAPTGDSAYPKNERIQFPRR